LPCWSACCSRQSVRRSARLVLEPKRQVGHESRGLVRRVVRPSPRSNAGEQRVGDFLGKIPSAYGSRQMLPSAWTW
jgi:hypothetical protein